MQQKSPASLTGSILQVPSTIVGMLPGSRQIFMNLLGNGQQFTQAGEVIAR